MKKFYKKVVSTFLLALGIILLPLSGAVALQGNSNPCQSNKYLYWVGDVDNDFFNELNWRETVQRPSRPNPPGQGGTSGQSAKPECLPGANKNPNVICLNDHDQEKDKTPKLGTLNPGQPIPFNLYIKNAEIVASGEIRFACPELGLTMSGATLNSDYSISQGIISLDEESTLKFKSTEIRTGVFFDFLDAASWIYWDGITPDKLGNALDNKITINGLETSLGTGYRINQYYQKGSLIRPIDQSYFPLEVFSSLSFEGVSAKISEDLIYRGSAIPLGDNSVNSFILKRGFMVTFAINTNGTGKSKVYIASEKDMEIDALPIALQGNVSFIRVVPWNWVTKKGTGKIHEQIDAGWFYNWNLNEKAKPNYDYVPMAWGASGTFPANIDQMIGLKTTTHILGFNESDNCFGQSGQFNNLCDPEVAVAYFENLMGTGVRLGSPAPRENGPTTWLLEFNRIAKERDVRFDFLAVHWYDYGSNPNNTPNANPEAIFNRFKNYLTNVYNIYQLPIWITEFNANENRSTAIQEEFLKLALPYLESLDYVERYAYFPPNPDLADPANNPETSEYTDENGNLTSIGELFLALESNPSIPMDTYASPNNLEGLDLPFVPKPVNSFAFEAECGDYLGSKWNVIQDENASNGYYIRGNVNKEGESPIAQQIHFEFDLDSESADQYRVWIRARNMGGNGSIRIAVNGNELSQVIPFVASSFTWFQIPRFYDLGEGRHRLTIEFPNSNILLDQVAFTSGPADFDLFLNEPGFCIPDSFTWGLVKTDFADFFEAENGNIGAAWEIKSADRAINGKYVTSTSAQQSSIVPPGSDGFLTYQITVEEADEYEFWAKIQAFDEEEYSLWISVDGEPFRKWQNLGNPLFEWYWKKFHHSYNEEDRKFSYFLTAGNHEVRIGYASGNVSIDRIAVASKGKLPEQIDPNVLLIQESLEFEAEFATILGNAVIQGCELASEGQYVNMGNNNSNGVRFEEVIAPESGLYELDIVYYSKVARAFSVRVNGENPIPQSAAPSGLWCFEGGNSAIHKIEVILKEGLNVIDINPFSGASPIIDKIKLEKSKRIAPTMISLEAEEAELIGSMQTPTCATASNGQVVNLGSNISNQINFRNININNAGIYSVEFHYFTPVLRKMRIITNGTAQTVDFLPTGAFCFEGGSPGTQTVELELQAGENVIQLTPIENAAPVIDKIVITSNDGGQEMMRTLNEQEVEVNTSSLLEYSEFKVFPNPVKAGQSLTIQVPGASSEAVPVYVSLTDMTGRTIYSNGMSNTESQTVTINNSLQKGIYVVLIQHGNQWFTKKLKVE